MSALTSFGGSNFHVSREVPAYLCCLYLEVLPSPRETPKAQVQNFKPKRELSLKSELDIKTDESERFF